MPATEPVTLALAFGDTARSRARARLAPKPDEAGFRRLRNRTCSALARVRTTPTQSSPVACC